MSYELEPEAAGEMKFQLSVNYEVANCAGTGNEGCVFFFDTEQGPEIVVTVDEIAPVIYLPGTGDVDCNVAVNSDDVLLMLQRIARLIDTLECEELADVNGDGTLNAIDAALTLQFVAGLINLPFEAVPFGNLGR